MTRKIMFVLALILMAGFATERVSAQGAPQGQAGGGPPPAPQTIDLAIAKKMVAAAEAAATAMNAHVAICVVDSNGDVVFFERMDMAAPRAVTSSQGKARAALLLDFPQRRWRTQCEVANPSRRP